MSEKSKAMSFYREQLTETQTLSTFKLVLGFAFSTLIMICSTWGLILVLNFFGVASVSPNNILPYTTVMLVASVLTTLVAFLICVLMIRFPSSISLTLRIRDFFKRETGEYFLCPEVNDQSWNLIVKRSLYGALLVAGIALTIISFDLLVVVETVDVLIFGSGVMIASIVILPFTIMQFFYAPWLVKDSGLFHLDVRDRSLSNVGDDIEDILEFVAGIDIFLVWLDLTVSTGGDAPWLPIFVILVVIGPLFSIVLNFTLVFMAFKNRATENMIELILDKYQVPDMVRSAPYIRHRILSLVDRRMLVEDAVSEYEEQTGESIRPPDVMGTMLDMFEDLKEIEADEPVDSMSAGSIRKAREQLERLERPSELAVTELSSGQEQQSMKTEQGYDVEVIRTGREKSHHSESSREDSIDQEDDPL